MPVYDDPLMRDPDTIGSKVPPGGGPVPGGTGTPPTFGFAGGGNSGLFGEAASSFGDFGALRALLKKRLALPTASPSYLTSADSTALTYAGSGQHPAAAPGGANNMGIIGGGGLRGRRPYMAGGGTLQNPAPFTGPSTTGGEWTPQGWNPSGDPTIGLNDWTGSGGDRSRTLNQLYELLAKFGAGGSFSPEGSRLLMDTTRSEALGNAEALRSRGDLIARNLGVDPATAASFALQSDLNTQGGVADALNSAVTGNARAQDEFGKSLLEMLSQFNMQDWLAERQGDISKRYAPDQGGGGLGGFLGELGGRALGGWLGRPQSRSASGN